MTGCISNVIFMAISGVRWFDNHGPNKTWVQTLLREMRNLLDVGGWDRAYFNGMVMLNV